LIDKRDYSELSLPLMMLLLSCKTIGYCQKIINVIEFTRQKTYIYVCKNVINILKNFILYLKKSLHCLENPSLLYTACLCISGSVFVGTKRKERLKRKK
jgi:hypothetical protein